MTQRQAKTKTPQEIKQAQAQEEIRQADEVGDAQLVAAQEELRTAIKSLQQIADGLQGVFVQYVKQNIIEDAVERVGDVLVEFMDDIEEMAEIAADVHRGRAGKPTTSTWYGENRPKY